MDPTVGNLNGILAQVGGNLNNNFQKSQMPVGVARARMLELRFDRYIRKSNKDFCKNVCVFMAKLNQGFKIQHSFQFI